MDKAVLIIDMPDKCRECPLHEISESFDKWLCVPMQKLHNKSSNIKPKWCPLKEMPQEQMHHSIDSTFISAAKTGYNWCINEILGE